MPCVTPWLPWRLRGDVKLSIDRIRGYREFVNKLWNASRFVFMNLEDLDEGAVELPKDGDLAPA